MPLITLMIQDTWSSLAMITNMLLTMFSMNVTQKIEWLAEDMEENIVVLLITLLVMFQVIMQVLMEIVTQAPSSQ